MTFTPNTSRLLVRVDLADEKTSGGIIIPIAAKQKPPTGTIVAAGRPRHPDPSTFTAGQRIMFRKTQACHEVEIDGEELLIINFDDVTLIF